MFYQTLENISIHALRGEGDPLKHEINTTEQQFQSTPSVGRATPRIQCFIKPLKIFQSTPSVGRATKRESRQSGISTISIHALRGEGDRARYSSCRKSSQFQSTPSVGRATAARAETFERLIDISIHALRGEGDKYLFSDVCEVSEISIHALRGEGDRILVRDFSSAFDFNPRPPWGGRHGNERREQGQNDFNPRPPWGGRRRTGD